MTSSDAGGTFADLVEGHKARSGVSDTELGRRVGVSRQSVHQWRTQRLRSLPSAENICSLAAVIGISYEVLLEAALRDTGYLGTASVLLDEGLHPILTAAAHQYARRSSILYRSQPENDKLLLVGGYTARTLARLWMTWQANAMQFLRDYRTTLLDEEPSITAAQLEDALRTELLGHLPSRPEIDTFLHHARTQTPCADLAGLPRSNSTEKALA